MIKLKLLIALNYLGFSAVIFAMEAPNATPETSSLIQGFKNLFNNGTTTPYQKMDQMAYEQEIAASVNRATTVKDALINTVEFKEESTLIGSHIKQKFSTEDIFKEFEERIRSYDVASVTILLQAGANPNKRIFKLIRGENLKVWHRPLVYACQDYGNLAMVQLLLAHGANPHKTRKGGQTALHAATFSNTSDDIAQELLQRGASWYIFDNEHRTPLSYAAESTHPAIKRLFEQEFLQQNQKYVSSVLPQQLPMDIQRLITRYVIDDVVRAKNADQAFENTKTYHAQNPHLVARLLSYRFSLRGLRSLISDGHFVPLSFMYVLFNIDDVYDSTLKKPHRLLDLPYCWSFNSIYDFHYSATRGFVSFSLAETRRKNEIDAAKNLALLDAMHTDNQAKLRGGILRLPEELNTNNYEQIKHLLNNGANPNAECLGVTPLIEAVCSCNTNAVQLLLEHNADTEQRDAYGRTAMHVACNNLACTDPENTEVCKDYNTIQRLIADAFWKRLEENDAK